ncbi:MAG: pyruvate dehydrogenase (acetyl-transferring) E1 component subunit alpha [Longimicrobiales bacterium]
MPREKVEVPQGVEFLSILDEDGKLDEDLMPDLSDETVEEWHRAMLRGRIFDEKRLQLQRQGRIGTFAPGKGQEAAQIGSVAALEDGDWMVPSFREATASLFRGNPISGLLLYDAGYNEGGRIPEEINDLPIAVPVGTQIPHAVGLAYGLRFQHGEKGGVVLTFFGDGATSEGDFHEALNWAQVLNAPVVFVCQNNQWAISVPRDRQTSSGTLAQKALAYGMKGLQVDGNDIFAVYSGVREAVDRARAGEGPTLVECVTYRLSLHTTADDPTRYRSEKEVEKWEGRDPLKRIQKYLGDKEILQEEALEELKKELQEEMEGAWEETKEKMEGLEGPVAMFDHVYAERPRYLEEQRDAFQHGSGEAGEGSGEASTTREEEEEEEEGEKGENAHE